MVSILPTIETCCNCYGTCSSDTKKNIKTTKDLKEIKTYANFLNTTPPPPPARESGESPRWRECLKEKLFCQSHFIFF